MASLPISTVLEQSQISPPPATVSNRSLPLTFLDFAWLLFPPIHNVFFYELPLTKTQFNDTIVPILKQSLSITLQHFFPLAGKLILFPSSTRKPEIRYVEGDSVAVTFAECTLDFNDLTGNHPRDCDNFYHLLPKLGHVAKVSDYVTIPVFSVQVTLFPTYGVSIGITNHHSLGDASTRFSFLKAWTSIAGSGTDELFLANGDLPFYDRVIQYPKLDEVCLKQANLDTLNEDYQPPCLSGPSDKVRATFVLTRTTINRLKKWVSTHLPTLKYVSSFTVTCAYMWSCIAKYRNDELELFCILVDARARLVPSIPQTYFGNCVAPCITITKTNLLNGKEGFLNAAELLGENLHKMLNNKNGILEGAETWSAFAFKERPTSMVGIAGTPKLKFYDADFGWGKPKKVETVSIDYTGSISMNACKECNEDVEIGMCLSASEMEAFVSIFNVGLEEFV